MDRKYGGVIWTNHAMQRLEERGINPSEALATWRNPDQSRLATARNSWIYYKTFGNEKIEASPKVPACFLFFSMLIM